MGFRINTNIAAMSSHMNSVNNNRGLDKSLAALSSGLRINTAADDASGLAIANQLNSQAEGLGQAIRNANDGINVAQTADGALEEYTNIINTVRTKAIQAASDGQNDNSRQAIQRDITKLLEEAQNIADTTSFNGQNLLDGSFQNKEFQIGAYANETVGIDIANTSINNVGAHATQQSALINTGDTGDVAVALDATFAINGTVTGVSTADSASGANTTAHSSGSAWAKAEAINSVSSTTGVTATAETTVTGSVAVVAGTIATGALTINGENIGAVTVSTGDRDHALINAINNISNKTNVTASLEEGKLKLTAKDGSDIVIGGTASTDAVAKLGDNSSDIFNSGKVTLSSDKAITVSGTITDSGFTATTYSADKALNSIDVTTRSGAQEAIQTADYALKQIDTIRSQIGSTQNQLESTVRNISVTQVNVTAAESSIRDVDFAAESANLQKHNILAQSGVYAMSQANSAQQNVMRLLQ